uniref:Uncharacterized protein n=1 Tax=Arundo donax TaxID=35708 RepID=A0A0A9F2I9_ARUDO
MQGILWETIRILSNAIKMEQKLFTERYQELASIENISTQIQDLVNDYIFFISI